MLVRQGKQGRKKKKGGGLVTLLDCLMGDVSLPASKQ